MARIRTIKPEFWTDDKIGEVSPTARLLLIAALNFSDDHGGLDRSSRQLKAQAFPYDSIDCEPLIQELLAAGLMIEYEVANRKYLHIKGFLKHQKIENPSKARIPVYDDSEQSPTPHREVTEKSALEGNGKGREGKGSVRRCAPIVTHETEWLLDFKMIYPSRAGDPNWRGAIRAANARIDEGHHPDEFLAGARRYAKYCEVTGKLDTEFVMQSARFLGPSKPFQLPWDPPATKADQVRRSNLTAAEEFMRRTEPAA